MLTRAKRHHQSNQGEGNLVSVPLILHNVKLSVAQNAAWIRLYDLAGTPGSGDTPFFEERVPTTAAGPQFTLNAKLKNGLAYQVSGAQGDDDQTAVTADTIINYTYNESPSVEP